MSGGGQPTAQPPLLEPGRRIAVILPDDGTDRRLLRALRRDKGLTRANTVSVRAVAMLHDAKTRKGRLPEAELARMVTVIVDADEADAVFEFIHDTANINRDGGGVMWMERLVGAMPYVLPADIADERE